ncbi:FCH domain-containing protein [Cryptosporidium felis]|nr:FCH domain-containing protein [Cryptosporidium felis]
MVNKQEPKQCEGQKQTVLKYQDEFINDWTLICTRIGNGLKLADQMRAAIEERAALEEMYSVGLEKISSKFFPSATESSSISSAIRALRNETYRRSQQCRELCETLRSDVLNDTLNSMLVNHKSTFESLVSSGKEITAEVQKRYLNYIRLRDNYGIERHNVGQLSLKYHELNKGKCAGERLILLSREILRKILELNELEKEYHDSVESFTSYHKFYLTEMKKIINILEEMDIKRIKCLSDSFMKMMVYDMSYIRNLQYDSDLVINSLQEISAEEDIFEFANRFGSSGRNLDEKEIHFNESNSIKDTTRFEASFVKKQNWREICKKMNSIEVNDDEFITLSTSQMAEKNITFDNMIDLQSIISSLVNPATAIKAQKAVKNLLSQLNTLMNEGGSVSEFENVELNDERKVEGDLSKCGKNYSVESFSTACSTEAVNTLKNEGPGKSTFDSGDDCIKEVPNNCSGFEDIYKEFLGIVLNSTDRDGNGGIETVQGVLKMIADQEYGLKEYMNCDFYLSLIMEKISSRDDNKLCLFLGEELTQIFIGHFNIILDFIQSEGNTWLFRKCLFISEHLLINEKELFIYIYKNDVWNVVKIWEETIVVCISENFQRKVIESDDIEFEKFKKMTEFKSHVNLDSIESLPSLMRKFGIPEIPIITLFTKICTQNGLEKRYCDKLISRIKNSN